MGYDNRKDLFRRCELLRGKPLISYVTSIRPQASLEMAGDAILPLIEQVQAVPKEDTRADFLIISNGGDPITALRIINILRERFEQISVLVPYTAFSAATLLALGADDIVMHPFSNLGPVDTQISVDMPDKFGRDKQFWISTEDIRHYFDFIRSDAGITDQACLASALNSLADAINPLSIGESKKCQRLSLSLGAKLLETHLKGDKAKIDSIVDALNSSYHHHGYAVSRKEAKKIGLEVTEPDAELELIMWDIWLDYCDEMKCNTAFDVYGELMKNLQSRRFIHNTLASLPSNVAAQILPQFSVDSASRNPLEGPEATIEVATLAGEIESIRLAHAFELKHYITCSRNSGMDFDARVIEIPGSWKRLGT